MNCGFGVFRSSDSCHAYLQLIRAGRTFDYLPMQPYVVFHRKSQSPWSLAVMLIFAYYYIHYRIRTFFTHIFTYAYSDFLCRALVLVIILSNLFPASLRSPLDVYHVEGVGTVFLRLHVYLSGLFLFESLCLWRITPYAPRLCRYGRGSTFSKIRP